MNLGEINELKTKLCLVFLRDNYPKVCVDGKNLSINSVGLNGREYLSLPASIKSIRDLSNISDDKVIELANQIGALKAGLFDKADVLINGIGYSIKSLNVAPPALINHTPRDGWEKAGARIGFDISLLDNIIDEYWRLRIGGIIKEDTHNTDPNCPFVSYKEYMKPILNYFLFKGSPMKDSSSPAEYLLDIVDPFDISSWSIYGKDFLDRDNHWEKLVFSLRAKKGMGDYPNIKDSNKKVSMEKWTKFFQGEYRGALHIRLKK